MKKLLTIALVVLASVSAFAQYGPRALVAPGDAVPPGLLLQQGGPLGRELAPRLGKTPILLVYWRPGDARSEQALVMALQEQQRSAPALQAYAVAVLAARQGSDVLRTRTDALGIPASITRQDPSGQLARLIGVATAPSFVLVDAAGMLRLVGGGDVQQNSQKGVTIAEAMASASRGQAVPTLGILPSKEVYQLLGKIVPPMSGTLLDGETPKTLESYRDGGKKRLLVFYWSPNCPHCKRALPKLLEWYNTERPADLELVDVARGDVPAFATAVPKIIEQYPWPHLLDKDRTIGRKLLVRETPTSYLISSDGEILDIKIGGNVNWTKWLGRK